MASERVDIQYYGWLFSAAKERRIDMGEAYVYYYPVLTNGETELEINILPLKFQKRIDPGDHILGHDGKGNEYIDGKPARIEYRKRAMNFSALYNMVMRESA